MTLNQISSLQRNNLVRAKWVNYGSGNEDSDEPKGLKSLVGDSGHLAANLLLNLADQKKNSHPKHGPLEATRAMMGVGLANHFSSNADSGAGNVEEVASGALLSQEKRKTLEQVGFDANEKAEIENPVQYDSDVGKMGARASLTLNDRENLEQAGVQLQKKREDNSDQPLGLGSVGVGPSVGRVAAENSTEIHNSQRDIDPPASLNSEESNETTKSVDSKKEEDKETSWSALARDLFRSGRDWFDTKGSVTAGWTQGLANMIDSWRAGRMFKKSLALRSGGGR